MHNYDIVVTSASGIEGVTAKELKELGFVNPKAIDGSFNLQGSDYDVARLNMFLRTGERVYIRIGEYFAETFDELFDGAINIPWENYITTTDRIIVNGKCKKSTLFAVSSCQSVLKKAILQRLGDKNGTTYFPESGNIYNVEFVLRSDKVTLMLNTSGAGLHKRGYRTLVGDAPLKETTACAMLMLSDFDGNRPFIDPFCGSGTIALEGARMALNIASGKLRDFDYQNWHFFDKSLYNLVLQEALDKETPKKLRISGFDIDKNAIKLALKHAENAQLNEFVHFQVQDVSELRSRYRGGIIVTNPPYGERLLTTNKANALYQTLGEVYRKLDNWSIFVITSAPQFEKYFGSKSDKNRKLYNADLECHFYQYFNKNF